MSEINGDTQPYSISMSYEQVPEGEGRLTTVAFGLDSPVILVKTEQDPVNDHNILIEVTSDAPPEIVADILSTTAEAILSALKQTGGNPDEG